jgi:hypothetical protein
MKVMAVGKNWRLLLAIAGGLSLVSCDGDKPRIANQKQIAQRCVDNNGNVVNDWDCEDEQKRPGYGAPGYPYIYHWYWGGPRYYVPYGGHVSGGTFYAPSATTNKFFSPSASGSKPTVFATSPGTAAARGLFGSSAHAFGEAGGGHGGVGE